MKKENIILNLLRRLNWEYNMKILRNQFRYETNGGYKYLHYRPNTSDRNVLYEIFCRKDYSLVSFERYNDICKQYDEIVEKGMQPLIIDAGANIGASSVWFASEYPSSKVITLEPEINNYEYLVTNTSGFDIVNYNAAIGPEVGYVSINNINNANPWGYQTKISNSGHIKIKTINDLIAEYKPIGCAPFMIKIDIEGFESELFKHNIEWMDQFYVIIIELHDWMLPKSGSSKYFLRTIAGKRRDFLQKGENIISIQY